MVIKKAGRKAPKKASAQPAAAAPLRGEEPARKHTINDIARLANVSKKTVSRVINESPFVREDTRTRIARIASGWKARLYFCARWKMRIRLTGSRLKAVWSAMVIRL